MQISSNDIIESMQTFRQYINVYVRQHNGNGTMIKIYQTTTLENFKNLIERSTLALNYHYQLIFGGKVMSKCQKPLIQYGIKEQSVIHAENKNKSPHKFKIDVSIFYKNEKFYIKILKSQTVYDLKQKIYRLLQIHPKDQKLIFQGIVLQDNKKIINYHLKNDSLISLYAKQNAKIGLMEIKNQIVSQTDQLLKYATSMRCIPQEANIQVDFYKSCKHRQGMNHVGYEIDIKENIKEIYLNSQNKIFQIKNLTTCDSNVVEPEIPQTQNSEDWLISEDSSKVIKDFQFKEFSSIFVQSRIV